MGATNVGGIGRNRDSQRISGFTINNYYTVVVYRTCGRFLFNAGIGPPYFVVTHSAKPTKRALALYTITVDRESCV